MVCTASCTDVYCTALQGSIGVGDTIELPTLKMTKQVRSMQMFKQPVNKVGMIHGDGATGEERQGMGRFKGGSCLKESIVVRQ